MKNKGIEMPMYMAIPPKSAVGFRCHRSFVGFAIQPLRMEI
jgi:hypothetical protein